MARRRPFPARRTSRGFVLIGLIALLTMGGLYWFISNLTSEAVLVVRQKRTNDSLNQARDALIAYALRYREVQAAKDTDSDDNDDRAMYGYLPLPDLGSSRNNNPESICRDAGGNQLEGCDANYANITYDANGMPPTLIGRFPWRTLGTGVLRDGGNECLWLVISSSHGRIQRTSPPATPPPMNWDTTGQLEIVTATDVATLQSQIKSRHDRPIAIVFAPGAAIGTQNRGRSTTDDVSLCGGNYDAQNYLESLPATLDTSLPTQRSDMTNLFAAAINNASGDTSPDPGNANPALRDKSKPLSIGIVNAKNGLYTPSACNDCALVANDRGQPVTSSQLFDKLRAGLAFRADINAMLERMVGCLRDPMAAGSAFVPVAITGYATPADKSAGRIPDDTCYNNDQFPLGYFSNYRDQIFVARPNTGVFSVNGAGACGGVLVFAGQRGTKNPVPADGSESRVQLRHSEAVSVNNAIVNTDWLPNYLEGTNLASFTGAGTEFSGPATLTQLSASQNASQDIVRCIPAGASITTVESPALSAAQQLVDYSAATQTLVLGKLDVTEATAPASALFGCAWTAEDHAMGGGYRTYFQFSFATLGTTVGNTGFVFAAIDAESNPSLPCGAAGSHLGYSGDNASTPKIRFPKIGIEFDQSYNAGYSEAGTNVGRNDPCGASSCGASPVLGYNSHSAIVYWGHEQTNATDGVSTPDADDNAHGFPTLASLATVRRPPTNPSASPGNKLINLRTGGQVFHVRVEITPTRSVAAPAENSKTSFETNVWIVGDTTATQQIAAMKNTTRPMTQLYPGFSPTLNDTAAVFDVAESACSSGSCPTGQTCGSDNVCYRPGLKKLRLGFTNSQRTQDQQITITNIFTTWLP